MSGTLGLAVRHLVFHRVRSLIIVACLTLVLVLPMTVNVLLAEFETELMARSESTPLLLGARGSRVDLVLKSLHFESDYRGSLSNADVTTLRDLGFGTVIPLHLRHRVLPAGDGGLDLGVADAPLVGTDPEYLQLRGLVPVGGTLPLFLGDAVLGANVAERTGIGVGDHLVTLPERAYDPGRSFQLKVPVVGVLTRTGTADDDAVFTDIKTAWVVDGIGHGHDTVDKLDDPSRATRSVETPFVTIATPKLARLQEITPENRSGYHFHGDTGNYPVTSAILVPSADKTRTIALARYRSDDALFLLEPRKVVSEVLGLVLRLKRFYDANVLLVTVSTVLFMALVMLLTAQLRQDEMSTLHRLGSPRRTAFWLQAWEILILLGLSAALAVAVALTLNATLRGGAALLH